MCIRLQRLKRATTYLDTFAREFCGNVIIGETFFKALVGMKFPTSASKFPFMRTSILAANLTCPPEKMVDGIARLITQTDLQMLTNKNRLGDMLAAEAILEEAWEILSEAIATQSLDTVKAYALFGRLASRTALFLVKKEKDGFQAKQMLSLQNIKHEFSKEMECELTGAEPVPSSSQKEATSPKSDHAHASDMADLNNPKWIANEAGFQEGNQYVHKATGTICLLKTMGAMQFSFEEVSLRPGSLKVFTSTYDDLKKQFAPHKAVLQKRLAVDLTPWICKATTVIQRDLVKGQAFKALIAGANKDSKCESMVEWFLNPACVRAKFDIPKGNLKLWPTTEMAKVVTKSTSNAVVISQDSTKLFLEAPKSAHGDDTTTWHNDVIFAAYWHVARASDASQRNMRMVTVKSGDFTFEILENFKELNAFDNLVVMDKSVAAATSNKKRKVA